MSSETTLYNANPVMFRNNPIGLSITVILCLAVIGIPILLVWWMRCKGTTLTITNERTSLRRGILSRIGNGVKNRKRGQTPFHFSREVRS